MEEKLIMPDPKEEANALNELSQKALNQYQDLVYQKHLEAAEKVLNDCLLSYEAMGIKQARQEFVKKTKSLLEQRTQKLNDSLAGYCLEAQSRMPQVDQEEDDFNLTSSSLEEAIEEKKKNYGVLTSKNDRPDLPEDLQRFLEED